MLLSEAHRFNHPAGHFCQPRLSCQPKKARNLSFRTFLPFSAEEPAEEHIISLPVSFHKLTVGSFFFKAYFFIQPDGPAVIGKHGQPPGVPFYSIGMPNYPSLAAAISAAVIFSCFLSIFPTWVFGSLSRK